MNAYRIVEGGLRWKIVRSEPDGANPQVLAEFATQMDAIVALADLLGIARPGDDVAFEIPTTPRLT